MPPSEFSLDTFDVGAGTLRAHLRYNGRKWQIKPIAVADEPGPHRRDGSLLSRIPLTLRRRRCHARPQRAIDLIHVLPAHQPKEAPQRLAKGTGARYSRTHGKPQ